MANIARSFNININVPNDILQCIFDFCTPGGEILTLSRVCRLWRHVTLQQSSLWCTITMEIDTVADAVWWAIHLPFFLGRSRSHLLRITLVCTYTWKDSEGGEESEDHRGVENDDVDEDNTGDNVDNSVSETEDEDDDNQYDYDDESHEYTADQNLAASLLFIGKRLAKHARRWECIEIDLGRDYAGYLHKLFHRFHSMATKMVYLKTASISNWVVPFLEAPNLTSLTLVDSWMKPSDDLHSTSITEFALFDDNGDSDPVVSALDILSHSLVKLTLSVYGWDNDARISLCFPHLTSLSFSNSCTLAPHLLCEFRAPALQTLELDLWRSQDFEVLLTCPGISFCKLRKIVVGWTAAEDLVRMHDDLYSLISRAESIERFEINPSSSNQCHATSLMLLYTTLGNPNGGPFAFCARDICVGIPQGGPMRLAILTGRDWDFKTPVTPQSRAAYLSILQRLV